MSDNSVVISWAIGAVLIAIVICSIVSAVLTYNVQWQKNRCEITYGANGSVRCLGPVQGGN